MNSIFKFLSIGLLSLTFIATTGQLTNCQKSSKENISFFKSKNEGLNYEAKISLSDTQSKKDISSLDILTIAVDPKDHQKIYLGTRGDGIYRSYDKGETWNKISDENKALLDDANVYEIKINPEDPKIMYAAIFQNGQGRLHKSTDRGQSWQEVYIVADRDFAVFTVEINPQNTQNIYLGTAQGGILKSIDAGESWEVQKWLSNLLITPVIKKIVINPQNPNLLYAATESDGVLKTDNGGATWTQIEFQDNIGKKSGAEQVTDLNIDPLNPSVLYASSQYGVIKSVDHGLNWTKLEVAVPEKAQAVRTFIVSPFNSNILYYGAGSVIYKSTDGGVRWKIIDLPSSKFVERITIDPQDPQFVYVGMHKKQE
jgi:photosystem II stability/assembly factor-like uncharacterized protein